MRDMTEFAITDVVIAIMDQADTDKMALFASLPERAGNSV